MPQEVLRPVTTQLILENVLGGHLDSRESVDESNY